MHRHGSRHTNTPPNRNARKETLARLIFLCLAGAAAMAACACALGAAPTGTAPAGDSLLSLNTAADGLFLAATPVALALIMLQTLMMLAAPRGGRSRR